MLFMKRVIHNYVDDDLNAWIHLKGTFLSLHLLVKRASAYCYVTTIFAQTLSESNNAVNIVLTSAKMKPIQIMHQWIPYFDVMMINFWKSFK